MGPAAVESGTVIRGVFQAQTYRSRRPFRQFDGHGELALDIHFFRILKRNNTKEIGIKKRLTRRFDLSDVIGFTIFPGDYFIYILVFKALKTRDPGGTETGEGPGETWNETST